MRASADAQCMDGTGQISRNPCKYSLKPTLSLPFVLDADFSENEILIVVPAGSQKHYITQFFTIVEDNIDEPEQSFAIVAEIGDDVPESISCFKVTGGSTDCNGRRGATEIIINDRKYCGFYYYCLVLLTPLTFNCLRLKPWQVQMFSLNISILQNRVPENYTFNASTESALICMLVPKF